MAFQINAEVVLRGPTNLSQVTQQIKSSLGTVTGNINVQLSPNAITSINQLNASINTLNSSIQGLNSSFTSTAQSLNQSAVAAQQMSVQLQATSQASRSAITNLSNLQIAAHQSGEAMFYFGEQTGLAVRRFAAFSIGAGAMLSALYSIKQGIAEAVTFDREMVRLAQVGSNTASEIRTVSTEISRLATSFGTSSRELASASVTIRQAGYSATETARALETLAQASLSPNFGDMNQNATAAIAVMAQFKLKIDDLNTSFSSINAVAAAFPVSAKDITDAVIRAGGSFASIGGTLNEFVALFTSVKSVTQESSESIATGLRNIFTRLQTRDTLDRLREMQINLRYTADEARALGNINLTGQFLKPLEAIGRIQTALRGLNEGDQRYVNILQAIGGTRQVGRALPLVRETNAQQRALDIANNSGGNLARQAETGMEALSVRTTQVFEKFQEFFRLVVNSDGFRTLADQLLRVANAFAEVLKFAAPIVPVLTVIAATKIASGVAPFLSGFGTKLASNSIATYSPFNAYAAGGYATGGLSALTPGEAVIAPSNARSAGYGALNRLNGGGMPRQAPAGNWTVPGVGNSDSELYNLPRGSFVVRKDSARKIGLSGGDMVYPHFASGGWDSVGGVEPYTFDRDFINNLVVGASRKSGIDLNKILPVENIKMDQFGDNNPIGQYLPRSNGIFLNKSRILSDKHLAKILLHEYGHAVDYTGGKLSDTPFPFKKHLKDLPDVLSSLKINNEFAPLGQVDYHNFDILPKKYIDEYKYRTSWEELFAESFVGSVGIQPLTLRKDENTNVASRYLRDKIHPLLPKYGFGDLIKKLNIGENAKGLASGLSFSGIGSAFGNLAIDAIMPSPWHNLMYKTATKADKLLEPYIYSQSVDKSAAGVKKDVVSTLQNSYLGSLAQAQSSVGIKSDLFHPNADIELRQLGLSNPDKFHVGITDAMAYLQQATAFAEEGNESGSLNDILGHLVRRRRSLADIQKSVAGFIPTIQPEVLGPAEYGRKGQVPKSLAFATSLLQRGDNDDFAVDFGTIIQRLQDEFGISEKTARSRLNKARRTGGFAQGGISHQDSVPALLTPGEYVFSPQATARIGLANLDRMNRGGTTSHMTSSMKGVAGYNKGGFVKGYGLGDKISSVGYQPLSNVSGEFGINESAEDISIPSRPSRRVNTSRLLTSIDQMNVMMADLEKVFEYFKTKRNLNGPKTLAKDQEFDNVLGQLDLNRSREETGVWRTRPVTARDPLTPSRDAARARKMLMGGNQLNPNFHFGFNLSDPTASGNNGNPFNPTDVFGLSDPYDSRNIPVLSDQVLRMKVLGSTANYPIKPKMLGDSSPRMITDQSNRQRLGQLYRPLLEDNSSFTIHPFNIGANQLGSGPSSVQSNNPNWLLGASGATTPPGGMGTPNWLLPSGPSPIPPPQPPMKVPGLQLPNVLTLEEYNKDRSGYEKMLGDFYKKQINAENKGLQESEKALLIKQKISQTRAEMIALEQANREALKAEFEVNTYRSKITRGQDLTGDEEKLFINAQERLNQNRFVRNQRISNLTYKQDGSEFSQIGGDEIGTGFFQRMFGKGTSVQALNAKIQAASIGAAIISSFAGNALSQSSGTADEAVRNSTGFSYGAGKALSSAAIYGAYGTQAGSLLPIPGGALIGTGVGAAYGLAAGGSEANKELKLAEFALNIERSVNSIRNLTEAVDRLGGRLSSEKISELGGFTSSIRQSASESYNINKYGTGAGETAANLIPSIAFINSLRYTYQEQVQGQSLITSLGRGFGRANALTSNDNLAISENQRQTDIRLQNIGSQNPALLSTVNRQIEGVIANTLGEAGGLQSSNQRIRGRIRASVSTEDLNIFASNRGFQGANRIDNLLQSSFFTSIRSQLQNQLVLSGVGSPTEQVVYGMGRFNKELQAAADSLNGFAQSSSVLSSVFSGSSQLGGVNSLIPALSNPLKDPGYFGAVESATAGLGGATPIFRNQALLAGRLSSAAPDILKSYLAGGGSIEAQNQTLDTRLRSTLGVREGGRDSAFITNFAQQLIARLQGNRESFQNPSVAEDQVQKLLAEGLQPIVELTRQRERIAQNTVAIEQQILNLSLRRSETLGRVADTDFELLRIREQQRNLRESGVATNPLLTGITFNQADQPFRTRINALGTRIGVDSNTPIEELQARATGLRQAYENERTAPGRDIQQRTDALTNFTVKLTLINRILEQYASSTQRAAYFQEQLGRNQAERTNRIGLQRQFLTGSNEDRLDLFIGQNVSRFIYGQQGANTEERRQRQQQAFNSLGDPARQSFIRFSDAAGNIRNGQPNNENYNIGLNRLIQGTLPEGILGPLDQDQQNNENELAAVMEQMSEAANALAGLQQEQIGFLQSGVLGENNSQLAQLRISIDKLIQRLENPPTVTTTDAFLPSTIINGGATINPNSPIGRRIPTGPAVNGLLQRTGESIAENLGSGTPSILNPNIWSYYKDLLGFATGGPVYANNGMMMPKGTDTVPAMLTPNEFVINRDSAIANRGLLEHINNAKGPVYLDEGGFISNLFGNAVDPRAYLQAGRNVVNAGSSIINSLRPVQNVRQEAVRRRGFSPEEQARYDQIINSLPSNNTNDSQLPVGSLVYRANGGSTDEYVNNLRNYGVPNFSFSDDYINNLQNYGLSQLNVRRPTALENAQSEANNLNRVFFRQQNEARIGLGGGWSPLGIESASTLFGPQGGAAFYQQGASSNLLRQQLLSQTHTTGLFGSGYGGQLGGQFRQQQAASLGSLAQGNRRYLGQQPSLNVENQLLRYLGPRRYASGGPVYLEDGGDVPEVREMRGLDGIMRTYERRGGSWVSIGLAGPTNFNPLGYGPNPYGNNPISNVELPPIRTIGQALLGNSDETPEDRDVRRRRELGLRPLPVTGPSPFSPFGYGANPYANNVEETIEQRDVRRRNELGLRPIQTNPILDESPEDRDIRRRRELGLGPIQNRFNLIETPEQRDVRRRAELGLTARAGRFAPTGLRRFATGGYVDNIPAMLSEGEFVMNQAATRNIGPANLARMQQFAQGGLVGGESPVGASLGDNSELAAALSNFSNNNRELVEALAAFPHTIEGNFTHNHNVNITGLSILQNLEGQMKEWIEGIGEEMMTEMLKSKLPDLDRG